MNTEREMLRHFLAAVAYRTQKALRDAPPGFAGFRAAPGVRTPHEIVCHMTNVLGYARRFIIGGEWRPPMVEDFGEEVARLHSVLTNMSELLASDAPLHEVTPKRLLQGPLADAMSHAGQLAMLRRFHGAPVRPVETLSWSSWRSRHLQPAINLGTATHCCPKTGNNGTADRPRLSRIRGRRATSSCLVVRASLGSAR